MFGRGRITVEPEPHPGLRPVTDLVWPKGVCRCHSPMTRLLPLCRGSRGGAGRRVGSLRPRGRETSRTSCSIRPTGCGARPTTRARGAASPPTARSWIGSKPARRRTWTAPRGRCRRIRRATTSRAASRCSRRATTGVTERIEAERTLAECDMRADNLPEAEQRSAHDPARARARRRAGAQRGLRAGRHVRPPERELESLVMARRAQEVADRRPDLHVVHLAHASTRAQRRLPQPRATTRAWSGARSVCWRSPRACPSPTAPGCAARPSSRPTRRR